MSSCKLPLSFYQQSDVVEIARQLVGKVLCTCIDDSPVTSGIITETEAYCGRGDKACHANNNTRTQRTETMYQEGGIAYIYLCYGIHHLFNVVTNVQGKADAILIRSIKPLDGKNTMLQRRDFQQIQPSLTAGPGRLTQALGITTDFDAISLTAGNTIWIEDRDNDFSERSLVATKRIGVDYAGKDASLPWRFYPKSSRWVSQK
jgi:DNA-3-methyladenine glycosylase